MANELILPPGNASGLTVTAKVYSQAGVQVGSDVSCAEVGTTSIYRGNMPTASAGVYLVHFTASTGEDLGTYKMPWTGSAELTGLDLATGASITALNNLSASDVSSAVPAVSEIQSGLATTAHVQEVEDKVDSVKSKTDGLNFIGDDLQATLNGEEVTTDAASRNASKADVSSVATQTDVAGLATTAHLQEVEDKVDGVKTVADGIKVKSDGLNFDGADIKATLDGEEVTTDAASRLASQANVSGLATAASIASLESNIRGTGNRNLTEVYDASGVTSISALQATANAIKAVVDKLTFDSNNDLKATLDGEEVTTDAASRNASKADVALLNTINNAIAALNNLSANDVLNQASSALTAYDPPTKAEIDGFQAAITALINQLNNISAADVRSQTDAALTAYDPPTKAELDSGLASLNDLSTSEFVTAMSGMVIEGSLTFVQFMRAIGAAVAGDGTVSVDGGTVIYSNVDGTKPVITASVDAAGNRVISKDLN